MRRVLLFDIDNTLLYSGGAGGYAMSRAFHEMFGVEDGFGKIEFSGRTDRFIFGTGLVNCGIDTAPEQHLEAFVGRYAELLPAALKERDGYLMPGFPELLAALRDAGARVGLATGNFSQSARLKLEHFEIDGYFAGGGFGEESAERKDVVAAAIERVADGALPEDILVIGDTPHDITSALDNNVIGVGVATGNYTVEDLKQAGAHTVFPDFSDWQSAARMLLSEALD
jgi:phosphoglycolate phosphatase-like HAD superfamily hydrolase